MKTNTQRKLLMASVVSLLVGGLIISSTGCQLIADFDRSLIEAGSDATTPDGSPDAGPPDASPPVDASPDATDGGDAGGDADAGDAADAD